MTFIIIWLFCAIMSAIIASNKGRSGGGWFLLGLIIGPFAFAVALLSKIQKEGSLNKDNKKAEEALRKCPFCAEWIKTEAIKCRFCGSEVPVVPANIEPDNNEPQRPCYKCCFLYPASDPVCPKCHTSR